MNNLKTGLFLILCCVFFVSCEKVIDIDLNDAEAKLVIEGNIDDEGGPFTIRISRTISFSDPNVFPGVSGAQIIISDNEGNTETLVETTPGVYPINSIIGAVGKTYNVSIGVDGFSFQTSCKMPQRTEIDTLRVEEGFFGAFKYLTVVFQDDPNTENYYRLIKVINGEMKKDINLLSDALTNGELFEAPLFFFGSDSLSSGDVVEVIMHGIDKVNYDFLRTLNETLNVGVSATPANPLSPFSPNALGYFSAHAVSRKTVVIP
jgi:hypothetical protein